jgi:hypothetical protein
MQPALHRPSHHCFIMLETIPRLHPAPSLDLTTASPRRSARACAQRVRLAASVAVACLALSCSANEPTPFHPEPPGLDDPPLDRAAFTSEVLPVFDRRGCSSIHCHGSGTHPFPLTGGADPELDFLRAADQVSFSHPGASPLLLKPLAPAAGGLPHSAPAIFISTSDPDFLVLARWVGAASEGATVRARSEHGAVR